MAGLGEETVTLDLLAEAWEINEELFYKFPKLKNGGGYELLHVPESGGKGLDVIAMPKSGYTTAYLKAVVHHAKIYIRPLQCELNLDEVTDTVSPLFLVN